MRHVASLSHFLLAGMLAVLGALGVSLLWSGVASAHASFESADPAPGTVLSTAPTQVTVRFTEDIDPKGSRLAVYHTDAKNTYSFDQESKLVSPENGTQYPLSNAKAMTITMQDDGTGIYAVVWTTVSADDGDTDSGVFFFGVGSGDVLGNTAGNTTSPAPPTSTNTTTSSGTPVWVPIVVGIVALLLGGALGAGLGRRLAPTGSTGGPTSTPTPSGTSEVSSKQ